MAVTL